MRYIYYIIGSVGGSLLTSYPDGFLVMFLYQAATLAGLYFLGKIVED